MIISGEAAGHGGTAVSGSRNLLRLVRPEAALRKAGAGLIVLVSGAAAALFAIVTAALPTALVISVLLACASCWLMHQVVGLSLRRLTITSFWYWLYLGFVFVPALFVFSAHAEPYRTRYLAAVDSALLTVPLGAMFANLVTQCNREAARKYFRTPLVLDAKRSTYLSGFLVLLGAALLLTLLYVLEVRQLPLFYLVFHPGQYDQIVLLREESLKLLASHLRYAYYVLRSALYPILILVALGRYLRTRTKLWRNLFIFTLAVGLVYSALSIAKSPVTNLVIMLALFWYLSRGGKFSVKSGSAAAVLFLAFPVSVVVLEQPDLVNVVGALNVIGERLFYLPAEILYYYFQVFPDVAPFQHGATIATLATVLGMSPFDDANFVGRYMYAHGMSSVTANAPFLGSLYADFGFLGVLAGGLLAGLIMQLVQVYVMRAPKDTARVALLAFLMVAFAYLNTTSLPIVLLSDGVLFAFLFVWILRAMN